MFPRQRYHENGRWTRGRGEDVRAATRTLAWLLDAESRDGWREAGWPQRQPRWTWRSGPRGFRSLPPWRSFHGTPGPRHWRPYFWEARRRRDWPRQFPRPQPQDWRPRVMPRRGPPVAKIKVPRWYRKEANERRPHGSRPGGKLWGGPERSAGDPQMPKNPTQRDAKGGKGGDAEPKKTRAP